MHACVFLSHSALAVTQMKTFLRNNDKFLWLDTDLFGERGVVDNIINLYNQTAPSVFATPVRSELVSLPKRGMCVGVHACACVRRMLQFMCADVLSCDVCAGLCTLLYTS